LASTDAQYNVQISEHILDQGCRHLLWASRMYVINKQLIIDVFGVCVEGYVEELKGLVNKSLAI
jgi:hypothetical protein